MPQQDQQQRLSHWQRVQCPEYRELGKILALLEALDRGEDVSPGDTVPDGREHEATLLAERLMSRRAACRRLLEITVRNMQAVCSQSISAGDDLLFYRCRVINEQKVLDSGGENGMLSRN